MPLLAAGRHQRPDQGACFMEYASILAGEPFSDQPACTHPILAMACRAINDLSSDQGRRRLVRHVPEVIGTRGGDPWASDAIVLACLDAAERYTPGRFRDARARVARHQRRNAGGCWARMWARATEPGCRVGSGLDMFDAARVVADAAGDDALYDMLRRVLAAYHGGDTATSASVPTPSHEAERHRGHAHAAR